MSCSTQSSQPTQFVVSVGSLPEGFCGTPQQLAQAIADRLIIQVQQNQSSFVTGSIAPTSNVGPWLKDCLSWYVFDDISGTYVPITKGGFDTFQLFDASGSFIVPANIYKLKVETWGGGGGGGPTAGGAGSAGGGGGAYAMNVFTVAPNQVIAATVGAVGGAGADGGNTTFLTMTAGGGKGATAPTLPGKGGVYTGAGVGINGGNGLCGLGLEFGMPGGDSPNGGAGGGDPSAGVNSPNGVAPGGGGAGADNAAAGVGTGASGRILVWY